MKKTVFCLLAAVLAASVALAQQSDIGVESVFDVERLGDTDIVLLSNGDRLTGQVLTGKFAIRTQYASLEFDRDRVAGIALGSEEGRANALVTINRNRFSGIVESESIAFRMRSGPRIDINASTIRYIVFGVQSAAPRGIARSRFLVLHNGDFFSGRIANQELDLVTTYATVPVSVADVESVTMAGPEDPLTTVVLQNGDTLRGILQTEDISVDLDIGGQVELHRDRIAVLYGVEGFVPELPDMGFSPLDEDFEDGVVPSEWKGDWTIDSSTAFSGSHSLRSRDIENGQRSRIEVPVEVPENATVSFAVRVSSEACCDRLTFSIDGQMPDSMADWGGSISWTRVTYPVPEGSHVLSWEYAKDGSVSTDMDAAWIDDVVIDVE